MAYATVEQLAAALRIGVTAANTASLQNKVDAASDVADQVMDRVEALSEPYPASVVEFTINYGVELWKAADAAFGVIGFAETGALHVSNDTTARLANLLMPYKQRWAIA